MTLLEVKDLTVSFPTSDGVVRAVRGVSFGVEAGRTLGIVGESGSGKTVLTQTLLGLTPGAEISGRALFDGTDLLTLSENRAAGDPRRAHRGDLPGPADQPASAVQGRLADRRDDPGP